MIVVQCIFGRWTGSLRLSGNIVLSSIILLRKYRMLLSHQIDDLKSISAPNNGQQELLPRYLLLDLFTDIIARHMQFRRMMKFQSKPTLVPSYNPSNMLFFLASRICNRPGQVSTGNRLRLSVNWCEIRGK
jgi:hypothetical protein